MRKLIFTHLFLSLILLNPANYQKFFNLYLLAIIQPAIPIIEYFVNYEYITNELCENKDKPTVACNGKCYLEKQVKKQKRIDVEQEAPLPPEIDLEKFITLKNKKFTYNLIILNQFNQIPTFYIKFNERNFIDKLLRPPIV